MPARVLRAIAALAAVWLLAGCALSEDKVAIDYIPGASPAPLAGAEAVTLTLSATDSRTQYADRVGVKKNGYGMEMARIVATNNIPALVQSALEQEFKSLGFRVGPGGLAVSIEIQNFYNNFKTGFASGMAVSEVAFALKVRNAGSALVYSQFYSATGIVDPIFLASGENAKAALQKALTAAVKSAIDDTALQQALLSARPKPSGSVRKPVG